MIRTTHATTSGTADTARLLDCSVSELPPLALPDLAISERYAALLESLTSGARASSGVVFVADTAGQLSTVASVGAPADAPSDHLPRLADLTFGLLVHGADVDDTRRATSGHACVRTLIDGTARMSLTLPLTWGGRVFGAVQLGFAELRTLEPTELRRLRMIADHIACAAAAARLERESARRQAEIVRVSAVLNDTDRLKGEFLSMMSHELRTPLTAIIGYTDLLMRQIHGPLTERQTKHQQAVKKAANRLLGLINDLLDVNRMESGHVTLNVEAVVLNEAVHRAVEQVAPSAELRGVELRLDVPLAPVALFADAERLQQIIANLLDNAVKFTAAGGTVTVRINRQGDAVTVSVIDTGIGVPPEQLERIWDRFHQADSGSRRQFGGTGLGLAIVRHLVELHRGTVSVSSTGTGEGSTFRVTLPTGQAPAIVEPPSEPVQSPPPVDTVSDTTPPQHRTILIVDDQPDNREVIASIVQDVMGHVAMLAENGTEALAAAEQGPDLILLDLRMPGVSGFEVARILRAAPRTCHIPIIAITALNDEQDRHDAIEAGCSGCLTKPFSQEALVSAVAAALATASAEAGG
jgi:signal transduction histidine kinase/ActR/RegA family two-component response regulator